MDPDDRRLKKIREAERLRDVPPAVSLLMGFGLADFALDLSEAADRARL